MAFPFLSMSLSAEKRETGPTPSAKGHRLRRSMRPADRATHVCCASVKFSKWPRRLQSLRAAASRNTGARTVIRSKIIQLVWSSYAERGRRPPRVPVIGLTTAIRPGGGRRRCPARRRGL